MNNNKRLIINPPPVHHGRITVGRDAADPYLTDPPDVWECPACGVFVADKPTHTVYHATLAALSQRVAEMDEELA